MYTRVKSILRCKESYRLQKGAILSLAGNILHNLTAKQDSIVHLTLSKLDNPERIANVVGNS